MRVSETIPNGDALKVDKGSPGFNDGVRDRWHILTSITLEYKKVRKIAFKF